MIGRTIGHYEVIEKIGEGGMGADLQAFRSARCSEWTAGTMPDDGGQVDRRAEDTPRKGGRIADLRVNALNRAIFVFLGLAETETSRSRSNG